jgi:hypothetical protein
VCQLCKAFCDPKVIDAVDEVCNMSLKTFTKAEMDDWCAKLGDLLPALDQVAIKRTISAYFKKFNSSRYIQLMGESLSTTRRKSQPLDVQNREKAANKVTKAKSLTESNLLNSTQYKTNEERLLTEFNLLNSTQYKTKRERLLGESNTKWGTELTMDEARFERNFARAERYAADPEFRASLALSRGSRDQKKLRACNSIYDELVCIMEEQRDEGSMSEDEMDEHMGDLIVALDEKDLIDLERISDSSPKAHRMLKNHVGLIQQQKDMTTVTRALENTAPHVHTPIGQHSPHAPFYRLTSRRIQFNGARPSAIAPKSAWQSARQMERRQESKWIFARWMMPRCRTSSRRH